jgi:hypothetical protein
MLAPRVLPSLAEQAVGEKVDFVAGGEFRV